MKILDRYIFKSLLIASLFISSALIVLIFLVQSLNFLEFVIEAGASGSLFWTLTLLALPRFLEIILPISLAIAIIFTYNRMTTDSELVIIRSSGQSPLDLAKPALMLAMITTIFLWSITMWIAPKTLTSLQSKRQDLKAQFSTQLFRPGVFNQAGKGLTVYARTRSPDGTLHGIMIHDGRENQKSPSTILAKRGTLSSTENGFQVLVYDGQRQEYDPKKNTLSRLNFERYTIELPDKDQTKERWQQPDERTITELLNPRADNKRDQENHRTFQIEIHRRIISPLLVLALAIMSCTALLIGPIDRRGNMRRILIASLGIIIIQSLYITAFNLAEKSDWGLALMYALILLPTTAGLLLLSGLTEQWRRVWLYKETNQTGGAK